MKSHHFTIFTTFFEFFGILEEKKTPLTPHSGFTPGPLIRQLEGSLEPRTMDATPHGTRPDSVV